MNTEIWKPMLGYEEFYDVSNFGRLRSRLNRNRYKKGSILKPKVMKDNYLHFRVSKNGVQKGINAHRMVARLFIPNPENKPEVNHINGIRDDNRVENLEWVTAKENIRNAIERGTFKTSLVNLTKTKEMSLNLEIGLCNTKEGKKLWSAEYHKYKKEMHNNRCSCGKLISIKSKQCLKCFNMSKDTKITKECIICGESFTRREKKQQQTCSRACGGKLISIKLRKLP